MLIYQLLYIIFVIILAAINARIIKNNKNVWHFGNGLIHIIVAGFGAAIWWWPVAICILCNTRVFFDIALNLFRGLPVNYVSLNPASGVDKIEKKIFGNDFYVPKIVYFLVSLSLNTIYFIFIKK